MRQNVTDNSSGLVIKILHDLTLYDPNNSSSMSTGKKEKKEAVRQQDEIVMTYHGPLCAWLSQTSDDYLSFLDAVKQTSSILLWAASSFVGVLRLVVGVRATGRVDGRWCLVVVGCWSMNGGCLLLGGGWWFEVGV